MKTSRRVSTQDTYLMGLMLLLFIETELQQEKERKEKEEAEKAKTEVTFKPKITKKKVSDGSHLIKTGSGSTGMDKYLSRQQQARALKQEVKDKERKVFKTGENWTPAVTKPIE